MKKQTIVATWAFLLVSGALDLAAAASNAVLEWDQHTDTTVTGYYLYRSEATLLTRTPEQATADQTRTDALKVVKTLITGRTVTFREITDLAPAKTYYFRLTAFKEPEGSKIESTFNVVTISGADQDSEVVVTMPALPAVPSGFTAVAASRTRVDLSWSASANAAVYVIQRKTGAGAYADLATVNAPSTVYVDNTAASGNTYTYQIKARNLSGDSAYAAAPAVTMPSNQAPTANAGADQTVDDTDNNGSQSVTLSGAASTDPDNDTLTYTWTEGGADLGTGASLTRAFTVGTHVVTLTVRDPGALSDTDTVTIEVQGTLPPLPGTPTGFTAAAVSRTRINLSWNASANAASYLIQRKTGAGAYADLATVNAPQTTYADATTSAGITYTYQIKARNGAGDSSFVAAPAVTTPANRAPTAVAGADQNLTDSDAGGSENVMLSASGSADPDGDNLIYTWTEGGANLGTGASLTRAFTVGTHIVTLTVRDTFNLSATDNVIITVTPGALPPAQPPQISWENAPDESLTYLPDSMVSFRVRLADAASNPGTTPPARQVRLVYRRDGETAVSKTMTGLSRDVYTAAISVGNSATDEGALHVYAEVTQSGLTSRTASEKNLKFGPESLLQRVPDPATNSTIFSLPDGNPDTGDMSVSVPNTVIVPEIRLTRLDLSAIAGAPSAMSGGAPLKILAAYDVSVPGVEHHTFSRPVTMTLTYSDSNSGRDDNGDGMDDGNGRPDLDESVNEEDLRLYWLDQSTWKPVGGQVNTAKNTVTAKITHFSLFALAVQPEGAPVTAKAVERFLTPALRDGRNDVMAFGMDANEVRIINVQGRQVFFASQGEMGGSAITWNCTDEDGRLVPAGVYIVKIKQQNGSTTHQTVAVAK